MSEPLNSHGDGDHSAGPHLQVGPVLPGEGGCQEQLGAGSRTEGVQAFAEAALKLVGTHPGEGIRWGSHLDRRPAVPGGWSAWGGVRVVIEVNRELKHAMPVTARRGIEAAESPKARERVAGDAP
jgi:hypothetical protein